ncbi:MAG: ABC transporter permease [Oligoflexia bacterium]|nr:ABC transporter permease [Oligoflexia bacterium]
MTGAYSFLLRRELRDRYPTRLAIAGELLGLGASLLVYAYTARAFAPRFQGGDYFSYLLIGEATLFAPLALFNGLARSVRLSAQTGTLEAMLAQPVAPWRILLVLGGALLPIELARALLTLGLGALLFGFALAPSAWGTLLSLQLLALPAFFGLGLLASSALLRFGRGEAMLGYLGAAAAIVAGAYFPTDVLPAQLKELAAWLSPFSLLLETTRAAATGGFEPGTLLRPGAALLAWGVLTLPAGLLAVKLAFARARRVGAPFLIT